MNLGPEMSSKMVPTIQKKKTKRKQKQTNKWHITHLQYSFSLVFWHKTYVKSQTNIILLYVMFISPIKTQKFDNFDIKITFNGYFLKEYFIRNE